MKKTTNQSVSYHISQRFWKGFSINRSITSCHQNFALFIWFQKESQLAALTLRNDRGFEKVP